MRSSIESKSRETDFVACRLVCKIPRIFERKVLLTVLNSRKIFKRDIFSSECVAKSAPQKRGFSDTEIMILIGPTCSAICQHPNGREDLRINREKLAP